MKPENLNPPASLRKALYIITTLGGPIIAYLQIKNPDLIGNAELALWTALTSAVALMAGLNVTPDGGGEV